MRQKDKVEKLLEDYPDVFADIINVLIYDGKQVISSKLADTYSTYEDTSDSYLRVPLTYYPTDGKLLLDEKHFPHIQFSIQIQNIEKQPKRFQERMQEKQ